MDTRTHTMSLAKKILRGGSIVILFTLLSSPLGYVARMIFARALSIESYGLLYAIIGFFWLFVTFNDLGFGYSVTYLLPKYLRAHHYERCWNIFLYDLFIEVGTAILLSVGILFSCNWLEKTYFHSSSLFTLLCIFSFYFIANSFVSALSKLYTGLQLEMYYGTMEFIRLSLTVIGAGIAWFYYQSNNVVNYASIWAGTYACIAIAYSIPLLKKKEFPLHLPSWDPKLFSQMFRYALPTLLTSTIMSFVSFTDSVALTYFRGVIDVGIYNIVLPIASMGVLLLGPFNHFLLPLLAEHFEDQKQRVGEILLILFKIIFFAALYFGLFVFLYPETIISIFFGHKWTQVATFPLRILAIGYIPHILSLFFSFVLAGMGKVKKRLQIAFAIGILSLLGNGLAAYYGGVIAVAFANCGIYTYSLFLYAREFFRSQKIAFPLKEFIQILLLLSVSAFFFGLVKPTTPSIVSFFLIGALYSIVACIVGVIIFRQERKLVFSTMKNLLSSFKKKYRQSEYVENEM